MSAADELEEDDLVGLGKEWDENNGEFIPDEVEADSFASYFYRSGMDWSVLNTKSHRTLRQTNLFQCWGFDHRQRQSTNTSSGGDTTRNRWRNGARKPNGKGLGIGKLGVGSDVSGQPQPRRDCPFYKKIYGTPFTVDAFRYGEISGCSVYFLSHFHADHYGGLTKHWSHGPICCTPLTARLVQMCLYVNPEFIRPLEIETEYIIDGVKVTLLEANHCPGAALIHFRLPNGECHLHTGDFRASMRMQTYPTLLNYPISTLYLDTTYCNERYRFPPKEDVLDFVVGITKNYVRTHPKALVVVGSYSIGKECVYVAISKALGFKIHASAARRRILNSFGWQEFSNNLCTNGNETPLHVLPISSLRFEVLEKYLRTCGGKYSTILAFRPTGWTFSEKIGSQLELIKPRSLGNVTIYGVPYSEHSSFSELKEFIQFLRPAKIIPTVNVGAASSRDKMQSYFRQWLKN